MQVKLLDSKKVINSSLKLVFKIYLQLLVWCSE